MVRTVRRTLLRSQLDCNEMQASARTCGRRAADSMTVFSYAIGSRKLSANERFFVGAQTGVSLLQTTQIISDVCFVTDYIAYAS